MIDPFVLVPLSSVEGSIQTLSALCQTGHPCNHEMLTNDVAPASKDCHVLFQKTHILYYSGRGKEGVGSTIPLSCERRLLGLASLTQ